MTPYSSYGRGDDHLVGGGSDSSYPYFDDEDEKLYDK